MTDLDQNSGGLDPRRWKALAACIVTASLTLLDVNIVLIALPSIGRSIHAHPAQLQWVVSGYALGFGLAPIVAGRLGDDRGRKLMLQIGAAGFVVASAAAGLAPNPEVLLVARFLQGLSGGLVNPQVLGLIRNLFPPRERPRAFAYLGTMVGVGSALGPVIGGVLIYIGGPDLGWRLTFLVNVPIGIVAFILCARWLPEVRRDGPARRLDVTGATLLGAALLAILFPAVEYDSDRDLRLAYLFIPAAILAAIFLWWEAGPARARGYPLIDTALFRIRSFTDGTALALFYFGTMTSLPLVLALFLQQGLGYSALDSAYVASASAVGVTVSSISIARLLPRYGSTLLIGALVVGVVGIVLVALVTWLAVGHVSTAMVGVLLLVPLAISGLGVGGLTTPNQALTLADVAAEHASTASGMLQTAQRIGLAVGSAGAGAVFYTVALNGPAGTGRAHQLRYGDAYLAALIFISALTVISLVIAIRAVRRDRHSAINTK